MNQQILKLICKQLISIILKILIRLSCHVDWTKCPEVLQTSGRFSIPLDAKDQGYVENISSIHAKCFILVRYNAVLSLSLPSCLFPFSFKVGWSGPLPAGTVNWSITWVDKKEDYKTPKSSAKSFRRVAKILERI